MLDPLLERLDVAVHHRRGGRDPEAVRLAHHAEPLLGVHLLRRDDVAHAVDEDLGAAARDRVEAGVPQARECLGDGQLRAARRVHDLRRRERVEVDPVACFDRREEILVVVDAEIGMMAALHEQAGAAEGECLLDLLEDDRLRQQVALALVAGPAVEGAEVAVGDADVRVVEVAVDDERHALRVVQPVADLVRSAADGDEVTRAEELGGVLVRDPFARGRLLEDLGDGSALGDAHATAAPAFVWTKRSSGTLSSRPASRASSRNV